MLAFNRRRISCLLPVLLLVTWSAGCGSDGPQGGARVETIPVTGIVHVDGEPASYLRVAAIATGGAGMVPMTPSALTAPDGKFELATYEAGDGVPPGEYQLTFVWGEISLLNGQYTGDKMKGKYAKSAASQYKINVNPGDVPIDLGTIELKTK